MVIVLVLDRADVSGEQRRFDDVAEGIAELHAIPQFERAGVSQHDARDHVRERRARCERDQDAQEHRDTSKRGRIRRRQVRERDDEPEGDEEHPDNLVRRVGPLGRKACERNATLPNLVEEQRHEPNRRVDERGDDDDEQELREIAHECRRGGADRREHIVEQPERDGAGPGEQPEDVRQVQFERQQDEHETNRPDRALDGAPEAVGGNNLGLLHAQQPRQSHLPTFDTATNRACETLNQPHDDGERQSGEEPVNPRANEGRGRVAQPFRPDGRFQLARVLLRDHCPGTAEVAGIPLRDDHQQP